MNLVNKIGQNLTKWAKQKDLLVITCETERIVRI